MTDIFEMMPTTEDIFRLAVPYGEPCGCYENRGCLESIYCSCECDKCSIQRRVDAGVLCSTCRVNQPHHHIEIENGLGETEFHFVCTDCFKIREGIDDDDDSDTETDPKSEVETVDGCVHICPPDCSCDDTMSIDSDAEYVYSWLQLASQAPQTD